MLFTEDQLKVLKYWYVYGILAVIAMFIFRDCLFAANIRLNTYTLDSSYFAQAFYANDYSTVEKIAGGETVFPYRDRYVWLFLSFACVKALFWFMEPIVNRNKRQMLIMAGGYTLSMLIAIGVYFVKTKSNLTLFTYPMVLLNTSVLFGVFYGLSKYKNYKNIAWALLGGFVMGFLSIYSERLFILIFPTFTKSIIIKGLSLLTVFFVPIISYCTVSLFTNYGDEKYQEEMHERLFTQIHEVSPSFFRYAYPVLALCLFGLSGQLFSLIRSLRFYWENIAIYIYNFPIILFYETLRIATFVVLATITVNFVIRYFKTLRKSMGWTFLFLFFPFFNIIAYLLLLKVKPRNIDRQDYHEENEIRQESFFNSLILWFFIFSFILCLLDLTVFKSYLADVPVLLLTHIVRATIGIATFYWLKADFQNFKTFLVLIVISTFILAITRDFSFTYSISSTIGYSLLFFYAYTKMFHVDWRWLLDDETEEQLFVE